MDSKFKGMTLLIHTQHSVVYSCQGKLAGVLFFLNYSIQQHSLTLDVIQVLDGMNCNLSKVNRVPCKCTLTLSLG